MTKVTLYCSDFGCDYTEQLRHQTEIPDPGTHLSERPDTPYPLLPEEQRQLAGQGREDSHWKDLEKGELISLF